MLPILNLKQWVMTPVDTFQDRLLVSSALANYLLAHILLQHFWNDYAAVSLLVVLHDGDEEAGQSYAGAVQGMGELGLVVRGGAVALRTEKRAARTGFRPDKASARIQPVPVERVG